MLSAKRASLQDLYLALLLRASPPIDGRAIVRWLSENAALWSTLICARRPQKTWITQADGTTKTVRTRGSLRHLRSMALGRWDANALWLLPSDEPNALETLTAQARRWGAKVTVGPLDAHDTQCPEDLLTLQWETPAAQAEPLPESLCPLHTDEGKTATLMGLTPLGVCIELLRRTRSNGIDGALVAKDLLAHRDLWRGAFLGISDSVVRQNGEDLHTASHHETLVEMSYGEKHSADQLWVLCPSLEAARALAKVSRNRWNLPPERTVIWSRSGSRKTASTQGDERIVSFWWA